LSKLIHVKRAAEIAQRSKRKWHLRFDFIRKEPDDCGTETGVYYAHEWKMARGSRTV